MSNQFSKDFPALPPHTCVHLYYTSFDMPQSRAIRSAEAQISAGIADAILFVGHASQGCGTFAHPSANTTIWNVPHTAFNGRFGRFLRMFQLPAWWRRVFQTLKSQPAVLIQCHSLAALPLAVALKKRLKVPLLYDAHELETEHSGWSAPVRWLAQNAERYLLRHVDQTIVVNESIAQWYRRAYPGCPIATIRNLPARPQQPIQSDGRLRAALGIPRDDLVFLYLGIIGYERGVPEMIEAFSGLPSDRHLVLLGAGPLAEMADSAARQHANIHRLPPVPSSEVLRFAADADVGLVFFETKSLSYLYSLPNKFFECLNAGLAVIANDMPEIRRVLSETGRGWVIPSVNANQIAELAGTLQRSDIVLRRGPHGTIPCWNDEEPHLRHLLARLMAPRGNVAC